DEATEAMAIGIVPVDRGEDVVAIAIGGDPPAIITADQVAVGDDESRDRVLGLLEEDHVFDRIARRAPGAGQGLIAVPDQHPIALRQGDLLAGERQEAGEDGADRRYRSLGTRAADRCRCQGGYDEESARTARADPRRPPISPHHLVPPIPVVAPTRKIVAT